MINGKINIDSYVEREENGETVEKLETVAFDYGALALHSTVSLTNLTVTSVYTTTSATDSNGALTITCVDGNNKTVQIRTASKLIREDQSVVVASDFPRGTVISVKGIVDYYENNKGNYQYQIKVFSIGDITVHD